MSNALMTRVHEATFSVSKMLRGEQIVLRDPSATVLATITDSVVTLDPVAVSRADGPAERSGVIRLSSEHHANAVASHTCLVRGETFDVLSVGKVYGSRFRVEIGKADQDHPNIFDINDTQAVWSEDV